MNNTNNNLPERSWNGQFLGWLYLAILVFFTWLPNSYHLLVAYPYILLWKLGFIILIIWAILLLRQFNLPFKLLGYGFDWLVLLVAITIILSASFAQFKFLAFWQVSLVVCFGIFLYVLHNWLSYGWLNISRLWIGVSLTGVITCLIGLIVWWQKYAPDDSRNAWPFALPNFLAGYVILVLPLTFFLAFTFNGWKKFSLFFASLFFILVLYTTSSRGGFLGLLVFLFVTATFWLFQSQDKQRSRRLLFLLNVAVFVGVILLSNTRVRQIIQVGHFRENVPSVQVTIDGESEDRILMWQGGLEILQGHPILGIGPGNMSRIYDLYRPLKAGLSLTTLQELHSTPVQIMGELGLMGLASYGLFLGLFVRLWFLLHRCISEPNQRYLLYGIGGSLLGYTFSSLTDYQLDHFSISGMLVCLVVLLIGLADEHQLSKKRIISNSQRRWLSLGVIGFLATIIILWYPIPWAMSLSVNSEKNFNEGNVELAYQQATQAAKLVPWDPIYHLQAAYELMKVRENIQEPKLYQDLTQDIITNTQNLVDNAAPNDMAFNQVLGMLYAEQNDNQRAVFYLGKAVQLLPRSPLYTYYLLGRAYLQQGKGEQAITALAIQGLIEPGFLTSPRWNKPPLSKVKNPVATETLRLLSVLSEQSAANPQLRQHIDEKIVLLNWWLKQPIDKIETSQFSPLTQALLLVDSNPQKSLSLINETLKKEPDSQPLLLLRAWLNPQQYLPVYLQKYGSTKEGNQLLENSIKQHRQIRAWLSSLVQNPDSVPKVALILTYRNYQGKNLAYIPLPPNLEINVLVNELQLFPPFPRTFAQLDELVNQVKTEELNLPHPTILSGGLGAGALASTLSRQKLIFPSNTRN